jgi:glutamine amidotransferase
MCRLLVARSTRPLSVADLLLDAPCSLRRQSRGDRRGERHGDGWGVASYAAGEPLVIRRPTSAETDPKFADAARVCSSLVVAHVRQASVGANSAENCHPFTFGRWTFAHNGTVQAFDAVRPKLTAETTGQLAAARRGETDSEYVFLWLLSLLERSGFDLDAGAPMTALVDLFTRAIPRLAAWSDEQRPEEPPRLNFVLTDGVNLAISRWGHSLWRRRREAAGQPVVIVASEPVDEPYDRPDDGTGWEEVRDRAIVAIDDRVQWAIHPI